MHEKEKLLFAMNVLKAVEWGAARAGSYCPYCRECKVDGHSKDCQLALALKGFWKLEGA